MNELEEVTAKIKQKAFKTWHTFPLGSKEVEVVILSVVEKVLDELEKSHVIVSKKQLREFDIDKWLTENNLYFLAKIALTKFITKELLGVKSEKELDLK